MNELIVILLLQYMKISNKKIQLEGFPPTKEYFDLLSFWLPNIDIILCADNQVNNSYTGPARQSLEYSFKLHTFKAWKNSIWILELWWISVVALEDLWITCLFISDMIMVNKHFTVWNNNVPLLLETTNIYWNQQICNSLIIVEGISTPHQITEIWLQQNWCVLLLLW